MSPHLSDHETRLFQAIVNAIPDMVIRIGRDKVFRSFEGKVMDLFKPVDACIGKTINEVMPEASAKRFCDAIDKIFAGEKVQHLEHSMTIGSRIQHYESRLARSSTDELIAIIRNVTREKETEQALHRYQSHLERQIEVHSTDLSVAESRYQDIFNHSGAPSIIIDQDSTISMANQKFEELVGYTRDEIENRMKWIDFIHPADLDMVSRYHAARRSKTGYAPAEYECRVKDRHDEVTH